MEELIRKYRHEYGDHPLLEQAFRMLENRDLMPHPTDRTETFPFFGKGNQNSVPIKELIRVLKKALDDGYESLCEGWWGYEDNYFVLSRPEMENDDEILSRLHTIISHNIMRLEEREKERAEINRKIAELQKQLTTLKAQSLP